LEKLERTPVNSAAAYMKLSIERIKALAGVRRAARARQSSSRLAEAGAFFNIGRKSDLFRRGKIRWLDNETDPVGGDSLRSSTAGLCGVAVCFVLAIHRSRSIGR
jgi:hypothetical protein